MCFELSVTLDTNCADWNQVEMTASTVGKQQRMMQEHAIWCLNRRLICIVI